jgi:hypothetical protein
MITKVVDYPIGISMHGYGCYPLLVKDHGSLVGLTTQGRVGYYSACGNQPSIPGEAFRMPLTRTYAFTQNRRWVD